MPIERTVQEKNGVNADLHEGCFSVKCKFIKEGCSDLYRPEVFMWLRAGALTGSRGVFQVTATQPPKFFQKGVLGPGLKL